VAQERKPHAEEAEEENGAGRLAGVYLAIEGSDKPPRQCEPSIVGATESGVEGSPGGRRGGPRRKKEREREREREREEYERQRRRRSTQKVNRLLGLVESY